MIDFERHEPASVEADPAMENEQIKEISRDGYDYVAPDGDRQTLRVARVVVVKNNL
jgi:molecular chaperone GrpE (heat shock protein)